MASGDRTYIADKTTLDQIHNLLKSSDEVYGFIENMDELDCSKRITYIGKNSNYIPLTVDVAGTHTASYGSWGDFPILKANEPYMVKANGEIDYRLSSTDYTKQADGSTASDVANDAYTGGAFSWLQKIYKFEATYGSIRVVMFSLTPREGFTPDGYIDPDGNELPGVWLPMFYGTEITQDSKVKIMSLALGYPTKNRDTATQKTYIDNFSSRAVFLGGPIINTIADLLIMFAKTNDIQLAYGFGNMSGYNSSDTTNYGMKENAVIGGGQFYGTNGTTQTTGTLNKIFHSVVLGTWQQWQRDPYTMLFDGRLKYSQRYIYDLSGEKLIDSRIVYKSALGGAWRYPHRYITLKGFGTVPDLGPYSGSQTTGGADGWYYNASGTRVARRFAACGAGRDGGPRCLSLNDAAVSTAWFIGASTLLLPAFSPTASSEKKTGWDNYGFYIKEVS